MAVTAFKCPNCGAKLHPEPAATQARCAYCGATSGIQRKTALFRKPATGGGAPPVAVPWHNLKAWFVVSSLAGLGLMIAATLVFKTSAPAHDAAGYTPGATYVQGEAVDLWYGSRWYDGTVKEVRRGGRYLVGYDGWSDSWDEVVTNERLRKRAAAPPPADTASASVAQPGDPEPPPSDASTSELEPAQYQQGAPVEILWGASWYDGTVKEVLGGGEYLVGYDGYSSSWDEVVDATRLKPRR
jgi:hypothetical protein